MTRRIRPLSDCQLIYGIAAALLMTLCTVARAYDDPGCIELLASRSDSVVTGIIERRETMYGPAFQYGYSVWVKLTVRTTESLLGDPGDEFTCVVPDRTYQPVDPAAVGEEALFLLVKAARYAKTGGDGDAWYSSNLWTTIAISERDIARGHILPLPLRTGAFGRLATMSLVPFTSRQEVMDHIRGYCVRPLPTLREETIYLPYDRRELPYGYQWPSSLVVPVDEASGSFARSWTDSPNEFQRNDAVRLLRHLHSRENADALAHLARQPVATEVQDVTRSMALATLADWGYPADWTRDSATHASNGAGSSNFWLCLALLPVASVIYWRRAKGRLSVLRAVIAAWILGASLLVVLLLRSFLIMDGFEYGDWKGGVLRGEVYVISTVRSDARNSAPFRLEDPHTMPPLMQLPMPFHDAKWSPRYPYYMPPFALEYGYGSATLFPRWSGRIYHISLWWVLPIWLLPIPARYFMRVVGRHNASKRRGFPVVTN